MTYLDKIMKEKHGFDRTASGGKCDWYSKECTGAMGEKIMIAITDDNGINAPESAMDPIIVGVYDEEGDYLHCNNFNSLIEYLNIRS